MTASTSPSGGQTAGTALVSYIGWLGTDGPRIAAAHAARPMPLLVAAVLARLTEECQSFTAYDVTMILRSLIPLSQRLLPHYDQPGVAGVQPEVHRQMTGYLISGIYLERTSYPNGVDPARLYVPATRARTTMRRANPPVTYVTDAEWQCVQPVLPPQKPPVGRPNADHRTILSGILWVQRTGRPWRELPGAYGKWSTVYSRYRRWRRAGIWQRTEQALRAA